ncbi:helix-turn-helix transcriptional regulator [Flammeovirga yaeyamensis]|uniref:Helix-turn-helix transcriptional regulator n=1 Tax=Flammeovirga yaeyamensis TaxID=367791 RepID=A0AAX1N9X7_9BACT|nr:helix-turn-helix domain-containing protein [Flammeovirga yaeyamensis]MBB3700482.1 AraC-like DNA-binding protein [Flammeovirga yaeyamensis]NMF36895.1 helix-turn-helix domain-containing protein [Flammeovirga yaeyamensis]QWG02558.1 helix-turn-helix transcriptional regulator [Flammeovirga yaeyamensis]
MDIRTKNKIESSLEIKVEPFRSGIRKTNPHKHHKYMEIVYLSQGEGAHTIDYDTYQIDQPILFFIQKDQMHHWNLQSDPKGYVIIMKKGFLDNSKDKQLIDLIGELSHYPSLSVKETSTINQLFDLLTKEVKLSGKYQHDIVEGLLKTLFSKLLNHSSPKVENQSTYNATFIQFKELLEGGDQVINSVNHYAELMHTTPQNLNSIVKNATGISASVFIGEYIIKEAKRMLLYTNMTASEIAFHLNFKDSSHFTRYFKRKVEVTPVQFRNS